MVIASMSRKLGLFAAACALGFGLAAGAAAQQAQAAELELWQDANGAKAEIVQSVEGSLTHTEGINYDVDGDGVLEAINLGYGTIEGETIHAALCIDNVEKVEDLPDGMEESSLKLELIKLPDGCLLLHAYGYCNESIGGGLDRLFKVEAGMGTTDPEFSHKVTTVLDCYTNPYLMTGKGVTHATATLTYIIGNYFIIKSNCMTNMAGSLTHFIAAKCSDNGKVKIYSNPSVAYTRFYNGDSISQYSPTLRNVRVYTGVNCKKYVTAKKGVQMHVVGVYAKGSTRLLQVQTKPSGSAKTFISGYIKLSNSKLFKYAKVDLAG